MADILHKESVAILENVGEIIKTPSVFRRVDHIINKSYLPMLQDYPIAELNEAILLDSVDCTCLFPIKRIVYDKEENNIQKLSSVYSSLSNIDAMIVNIIRGYENGETELFLGICDQTDVRINGAYPKTKAFLNSFVGNFSGCRSADNRILNNENTRIAIHSAFCSDFNSVSSVSCIGSLRGQNKFEKNSDFFQGMEKVIEALNGKEYTILVMARPVLSNDIQQMRSELEDLYTKLSVFAKMNISVNQSEAETVSSSVSNSLSKSVTDSKSKSLSIGENTSVSDSSGSFSSTSKSFGMNVGGKDSFISGTFSRAESNGISSGHAVTSGNQITGTETIGKSITDGNINTHTDTNSKTGTSGKTIQLSIENKRISEALNTISQQLQRLKQGSGSGLFATSTYVLSDSVSNVRTAASLYKAVVSGETTSTEYNGINIWSGKEYQQIVSYLRHFLHPVFQLTNNSSNMTATPATVITSTELAVQMGLPQHSIDGIPVKEAVPFGRNVFKLSSDVKTRDTICLGNIYHLGTSLPQKANLDIDSLTMHTFITGTTGSGKSNTIYGLVDLLCSSRQDVHFLIIEPAKGEYKNIFGNRPDVKVYGTNPYITNMFRINPFRFNSKVHILEHIDRLISLFNVCWPMEAAMPAVLKQSIERAYEKAGWNLRTSANRISKELFPDFQDVMDEVDAFIEVSDYSAENKGNYKGALCTRLRELTSGLNGMMFVSDEIEDETLFDHNVIVDLSRVGSSETKSLIMGLLIIRLQEYRQISSTVPNSQLRHITVLEEAHNLLKRISTEQSMDSANIAGKSVEMISNSLAEMRTYGEGFVIADQSPEQMDLSVIRNTNTKIIMRLPSYEDRKLVGKSASLNDAQIDEISKLPTGIAAVFQNDWMDSVLVKIPYYQTSEALYQLQSDERALQADKDDETALLYAMMKSIPGMNAYVSAFGWNAIEKISKLRLSTTLKSQIIQYTHAKDENTKFDIYQDIAFSLFNSHELMECTSKDINLNQWRSHVERIIVPKISEFGELNKTLLLMMLSRKFASIDSSFAPIFTEMSRFVEIEWEKVR
ncbi:MAG: ATP-binding protein [Oscillospiraceae bacterium]|nr:ATP-binding protein [Oscillospiraceae bacterium]